MDKKNNYTKQDIDNYWQGKLSDKEMHNLEKAAIKDEFLSDALDGYRDSNWNEIDTALTDLKKKITENTTTPNKTKRKYFLMIAATIAVLVIGTYTISIFLNNNRNNKYVISENITNELKKERSVTTIDSLKQKTDISVTHSIVQLEDGFKNKNQKTVENLTNNKNSRVEEKSEGAEHLKSNTFLNETIAKKDIPTPLTIDETKIKNDDLDKVIVSNTNEKVQQNAVTSNIVNIDKIGNALEPENGWVNFNKYIENSTNKKEFKQEQIISIKNKHKTDEVEVEFDVDENGKPINLNIVNSTNKKNDSAAIKIIKEGPKWLNNNTQNNSNQNLNINNNSNFQNKKTNVKIKF